MARVGEDSNCGTLIALARRDHVLNIDSESDARCVLAVVSLQLQSEVEKNS